MKKSTHKRLTAWLLTLALVVTLLPGMGMTALAVEDGGEGNGPPAVEVVAPEDESSGLDETVGTPPQPEPEPPALPESKEEDKTTEDEGDPSGSDYDIEADTQPRGLMRMPVMPTAAGNYPAASSVFVDGDKQFYDPGSLYYINGDQSKRFTGDANNYNAAYDPTTGTLKLKNYNGKGISVGGVKSTNITVVLIGTNIIKDGSLTNGVGGDITITSSSGGTLSITRTLSGPNPAIGIEAGFGASYQTGNVTIKGNAEVTINMTHNGTSTYERAYGIYAKKNITISGDASVDITCATPSNTGGGDCCNGLYADKKVTIDTNGTIKIDVTKAGNDSAYSYGIYPMGGAATLTKVGNMEVQWKKGSYSGSAFFRGGSFDTSTYAVNEDTTNCYVSYRKGTPYTVTAGNGKLTGPGVKYPNGSGKFLAGDKVYLIAPDRQISATDSTPIPFVKWTSADVSVTNPTSQNGAYIMVPYTDTTVQAHYKAFTVQPSFTRKDSDQGTVSCTLISTEHSGYPKICRADTLGEVSSSFRLVDSSTTYESEVYKNYNPPGEYVVRVKYNNVTYYSEPFVIDYSERAASVSPVTISGETGQTIIPAAVTVTLQDCTFNTSLGGTGSWITNLPAGLTQSVTRVSDTEAKITVSGTPVVNCVEQIKVTVPKAALSGGTSALTAPSYESANFDIKTTLTAAAATIHPPVAGQHPDMNPVSADPSKYTVDFAEWSVGSSAMSATDTFEAGKWYYCYLTFTPKSGYAFASGSDMTYTINGDDAQTAGPWVRLAMKALPSAISLDVSGTVDLGNTKPKPYGSVLVKSIEVTNHLSSEISNIPITLSDPTNFRVLPKSITSIPANGTGTFQVASAQNLPVGYYSTTVTVGGGSSGIIEQSFTVEFSVCEVIMLIATPLTYNGEWQTGVTASVAGVTIERNSQRDAGDYTATAYRKSGFYMWPDYTTDSTKDISWSIGKRDPKIEDFDVTLPDDRTEWEMGELPYVTYDGNAKTATATLKTKYSGCGDITVKYKKFVSTGTYETLDEAIDAGTYTVLVCVAPGGKNYNAADVEYTYQDFTIRKAPLAAPKLTVEAPTTPGGKGKIVGTTTQMRYAPVSGTASTCSDGATEVYPGKYWVQLMADPSDTNHDDSGYTYVTVPEYGAGVTVSGTAVSWNDKDNAEYYLYPTTMSDADIRAQWKTGSYTGTACTSKGTPTASGKQFEQTFQFDTVTEGNYKLVIFKPGKYVPKIVPITVESTALDLGQLKLWLYGDVNYDGAVKTIDITMARQYFKGNLTLTDEQIAVMDMNGDGTIKVIDITILRQYFKGNISEIPIT